MNKKRVMSILLSVGIISQIIFAPGVIAKEELTKSTTIETRNNEEPNVDYGVRLIEPGNVKSISVPREMHIPAGMLADMDRIARELYVLDKQNNSGFLIGDDIVILNEDKIRLTKAGRYNVDIALKENNNIKTTATIVVEGSDLTRRWIEPEAELNFEEDTFYTVGEKFNKPKFSVFDDLGTNITKDAKISGIDNININQIGATYFGIESKDRLGNSAMVFKEDGIKKPSGTIYYKPLGVANDEFKKEIDNKFKNWKMYREEISIKCGRDLSKIKLNEIFYLNKDQSNINEDNFNIDLTNFRNLDTSVEGEKHVVWSIFTKDGKYKLTISTPVYISKFERRFLYAADIKIPLNSNIDITDFDPYIPNTTEIKTDKLSMQELIKKYDIKIKGLENVNLNKEGTYQVEITAKYPKDGIANGEIQEVKSKSNIVVYNPYSTVLANGLRPTITSKDKIQIKIGSDIDISKFEAKAVDFKGKDISKSIEFQKQTVNTKVKGLYPISILAEDSMGRWSEVTKKVEIVDEITEKININNIKNSQLSEDVYPSPTENPIKPVVENKIEEKKQEEAKPVARMGGKDRYDTSMKIADKFKAKVGKIEGIVLASGENFPDALSGAVLCKQQKAPMLLVNNQSKTKVLDYIKNNLQKGQTVNILGGTGVVNEDIKKEIEKAGYKVERLQGKDRYETNNKIVAKMGKSEVVFLATGNNYADAMSASAVAGKMNAPIVLCKDKLDDQVLKTINDTGAKEIVILGGKGAINENVEKALNSRGYKVERVSGKDRYETNQNILTKFGLDKLDSMAVADGNNYADALTGAGYSSLVGQGIKLINTKGKNTKLPTSVKNVEVFGGEGIISNKLVDSLK